MICHAVVRLVGRPRSVGGTSRLWFVVCITSNAAPLLVLILQVTHVGEMVDRHILSETLTKQTKAFRRRTLPPTLRQVHTPPLL